MIFLCVCLGLSGLSSAGNLECSASNSKSCKRSSETWLTPEDIHGLQDYTDWLNETVTIDKNEVVVANGKVSWPSLKRETKFVVLPGILKGSDVKAVMKILRSVPFNDDLDSVDAMPTQELYVHKGDEDITNEQGSARASVREQLRKILQPAEDKITKFAQHKWPDQCNRGRGRDCRACFSIIRKYIKDERRTHMMHRDGQAIVTSVVSFSEYGQDYRGGLYVAASAGGRQTVALRKGDAVVHQYDLLHGVEVDDDPSVRGDRWSWIMWFHDSSTCKQYGYEWSKKCALQGDAICQYTHGWRMFLNPSISRAESDVLREKWMTAAAEQGLAEAMLQVGRSHLGRHNLTGAMHWFSKALTMNDPDAAYQVGHLALLGLVTPPGVEQNRDSESSRLVIERAAFSLFQIAASHGSSPFRGAPFAMYNLGIAWLYGFAGLRRDPDLALQWFQKSGLPEGLMAMSVHRNAIGDSEEAQKLQERAQRSGFGQRDSRDMALFGLHSNWPSGPPQW